MSESDSASMRVDRTALSLVSLEDDADRRYWQSRTPAERLRYVEYLRRINYGARATEPMERVMEIVTLPWATNDDRQP